MKKRIFALLLCLALCASLIPAAAAGEIGLVPPPAADEPNDIVASGNCGDNLTWKLDDNGTLGISGSGDMWNYVDERAPWYDCKSDIKAVVIGDGVTSIGKYAFLNCFSLISAAIPGSVTSIGDYAFNWCRNMESAAIPGGVTYIGDYAFGNCESLKSATIPDGVTSISTGTFSHCKSLKSVTIPDGVTSIGRGAFSSCQSLVSVTVGICVKEIGGYAFSNCRSMRELVFRGGAPDIESYAFIYDALVAYYPARDAGWTSSVRQSYDGFVLWVPDDGPRVTLDAYNYPSVLSGGGTLRDGVCAFTLASDNDRAVLAAVKDGDGYTRLPCTTDDNGFHRFSLTMNADTKLVLALKGDVNLDGELKGTDGTMLKRAVLGSYHYPEDRKALCELVADLNGDGTIKGSEGTQIARAVLGTFTIKW